MDKVMECFMPVFADRYKKLNITYNGNPVYEAIYDKPVIASTPYFAIEDCDEVYLADDRETEAIIKKLYK